MPPELTLDELEEFFSGFSDHVEFRFKNVTTGCMAAMYGKTINPRVRAYNGDLWDWQTYESVRLYSPEVAQAVFKFDRMIDQQRVGMSVRDFNTYRPSEVLQILQEVREAALES
jgi:hypothetical protein